MTNGSKRKEEVHLANGGVKQSTWSKVLNSTAVWEEKVGLAHLIIKILLFFMYIFNKAGYLAFSYWALT